MERISYEGLTAFIAAGRNKIDRPLANNTRAVLGVDESGEKYAAIRLHRTEVVRLYEGGDTALDSGGWLTVTTKDRMNYLPWKRFRIWSERGVWFVKAPTGKAYRFFDGMRFTKRGRLINPQRTEAEQRRADDQAEKLRKEVRAFVTWATRDLAEREREANTSGDCWYCLMKTADGQALGDAIGNHAHLLGHMEEQYAPLSLYVAALGEAGCPSPGAILGGHWSECGEVMLVGGSRVYDWAVERSLYRYLTRRLLPERSGAKPVVVA